jgi:cbb3-type cytochrome oxidase subunit 1
MCAAGAASAASPGAGPAGTGTWEGVVVASFAKPADFAELRSHGITVVLQNVTHDPLAWGEHYSAAIRCGLKLIPVLWGRNGMHSVKAINAHFWLATIGTVLYIASMWVNGIMQGLMWRAYNSDGTLTYSFAESVLASHPGYIVRLIGGAMFFLGMLVMAWNTWKTVLPGTAPVTNAQAQPA